MNQVQSRHFFLSIYLMFSSLVAAGNELSIAGKSAQDVFRDKGVISLLKAVINQDASEAKQLVASGVNVNTIGDGGITPVIWMLGVHDVAAIKMLMELGADPNKFVPSQVGETGFGPPVWLAAGGGQKDALQVLLVHGGDPNLAIGGQSPLMMAISGQHMDCAELLLQHGGDINYSAGSSFNTALGAALLQVQFGDALWVLNHGYTRDLLMGRRMLASTKPRPGQEALKAQAIERIEHLLIEHPSAGENAKEVFGDEREVRLLKAVIFNNPDEAKRLVASGVDVNAAGFGGQTLLQWVESNSDAAAVKMLLELGADPNLRVPQDPKHPGSGFQNPVWSATASGKIDVLRVLLDHGGSPRPIMAGLMGLHFDCVELLLQRGGVIPNSAIRDLMTRSNFDAAVWILDHGYKYDLQNAKLRLQAARPYSGKEALKEEALLKINRLIEMSGN